MYKNIKRILDIVIACTLLIILLPIFLIISIHLTIIFKQIIYKQERSGINNSSFTMYKFVTMKNNKTTIITRFYRKFGIDELPQLINIIKGDMSFVGPRPWILDFSKYFDDIQKRRLEVLPGLTGYSQIIIDNDIFRRIDRDIYYVDNYNFLFDLKIIIKTMLFIIVNKNESGPPIKEDIKKLKNQRKVVTSNYSVVLPVCDKDNPMWLNRSIKSVLNQSYKTNDFIIVSDGKLNKSLLKIINKYTNIKYIQNKKIGLANILNIGIDNCKNNWIARIDADDYWNKDKMNKQLLYLENHKDVFLLGTNMQEFINNKKLNRTNVPINHDQIVKYSKYRNPFRHSSVVFNKDIIKQIGGYSDIKFFEDYDLWLRVINKYQTHNLDECLTYFRISNNLYKRRGGFTYYKSLLEFEKKHLKLKNINIFYYLFNITIRGMICLLPNNIRKVFYENILRRKHG